MGTFPTSIALPVCEGHDHQVEFYETEAFLTETVYGFLAPGLRADDAAIVVATPEHRAAFERALTEGGLDLEALAAEDRYVALDAEELLGAFMTPDGPDQDLFRDAVGAVMDRVASCDRGVRVYGEMVAVLWGLGDAPSAITLEEHWNDLATERDFALLCAYPMSAFDAVGGDGAFQAVCDRHTKVIPSRGFARLGDADQQRMVATLQRENAALRGELARSRGEREALAEIAYVDGLTGLGNRRAFDLHLEREWALSLRDGIDSYLVVGDLDRFKALNDTHGHAAGDAALQAFARALRTAARSTDVLARIGGDEFAVLLIRADERAAHSFKSRLLDAVALAPGPDGIPLEVTLGHASLQQSVSAAAALDRADRVMLARKRPSREHVPLLR